MILLNGPPGVGKSTVARMYAHAHPLSLNLDIDQIRSLIGGWRDTPDRAGLLARAVALAAARVHLAAGHDVVMPQFVGRPAFLMEVEQLARHVGADFHEIVLLDGKENSLRRFAERSSVAAEPSHADAQRMVDRAGGAEALSAMYDRLIALLDTRPAAKIVCAPHGQVANTYRTFLASLG